MSCFNEKKKNPIAFVCLFSESTLLFTMCDLTEIIIATTFLFYTKKNTIQLVKDLKLHKKIYFRLRFVEQQKWLAMCLSNDLC